jgi:alkanesulfonate monooxygenase SsuD/methylene tetrahydromethanopterin reductase-like flavin-dependent oxidoreductase (luciferase family)
VGGLPLFGTAEQVAERIAELYRRGIDGVLLTFLEFHADVLRFEKEILPLLREMGVRA